MKVQHYYSDNQSDKSLILKRLWQPSETPVTAKLSSTDVTCDPLTILIKFNS